MAKQNVYDDPESFAGYRALRDHVVGLHENVVQTMLPEIVPDVDGKRVVDLGCGEGFFCRLARSQGAAHVIGIDPSEKMLTVARERTDDDAITYTQAFAEDAKVKPETIDVVVSILALHYVEDFEGALISVRGWLVPGGGLMMVVEHPVATAPVQGTGYTMEGDAEEAWLLSHYFDEGVREQEWYVPGVIKYHRKLATMVNSLIALGFVIEKVCEPAPTPEVVAEHPRSRGDSIRPGVLGIRARTA